MDHHVYHNEVKPFLPQAFKDTAGSRKVHRPIQLFLDVFFEISHAGIIFFKKKDVFDLPWHGKLLLRLSLLERYFERKDNVICPPPAALLVGRGAAHTDSSAMRLHHS